MFSIGIFLKVKPSRAGWRSFRGFRKVIQNQETLTEDRWWSFVMITDKPLFGIMTPPPNLLFLWKQNWSLKTAKLFMPVTFLPNPKGIGQEQGHHWRSSVLRNYLKPVFQKIRESSVRSTELSNSIPTSKRNKESGFDLRMKRRSEGIPDSPGRHVTVHMGEYVRAGDPLIDGSANPHDILAVKGTKALQKYLVDEIQQVHRLQGVGINDKHISDCPADVTSSICRRSGDSSFLIGQEVMKTEFDQVNRQLLTEENLRGQNRNCWESPKLLWVRILSSQLPRSGNHQSVTDAALGGKYDTFRGLKENVILEGWFAELDMAISGQWIRIERCNWSEELIRRRQEELEAMQNEMGITAGTIENLNQEAPAKMAPEATS